MGAWPSIADIAHSANNGQITALQNVNTALKLIRRRTEFKAVVALCEERAIERAKAIDAKAKKAGSAGQLAGVPFIAKDNFLAFGTDTTAASNILKGFDAPYQATAIERLEAAGAICVAKANLDAFAHGSSTENSDFFTTRNPQDKTRVPGGSSGGSAAAVALDMVPFALGTDTGGSIRLPAAFCGVVGYKPTYGLVSRSGVIAMASSTDVIGPLANSVNDAALVLDVMAGQDPLDSTTIACDKLGYIPQDSKYRIKGKKIGIIKEYMGSGVDAKVKQQIEEAVSKLRTAGAQIIEVSLPSLPLALAVYYIVCPAEISSNLSRYDGQRYGLSSKTAKNLSESYTKARSQGFNAENKRRIMIGTYVLSSGYYDAYYKRAQIVRTKLIDEFNQVFSRVDFLAGPVAPTPAFKIGANIDDPLKMYLADVMTVAANLTGVPAISVPAGSVGKLPVGLQLIAPQRHDRQLLALASAAEALAQ